MNYLRPASRTSIYLATMQLVIDRHFVSVLLEGRSFLPEGPSHIQDVVLPAGQRLCTKVLPEALLAGQAAVRSTGLSRAIYKVSLRRRLTPKGAS
jgi:hypothetical protein